MKFSIITITRNNAEGLSRTLESLAAQSFRDFEHIIVDGESDDNTLDIIKQMSPDSLIVSAQPRGVYDAINRGLGRATGEIIGTLNAGDTYTSPDSLARVAEAFNADSTIDFTFADIRYVNAASGRVTRYYSARDYRPKMLGEGYAPPHPSLYVRRAVQHRLGDYDPTYKIAGDFEMFLRLFGDSSLKSHYINTDLVTMDTGGISARLYNKLFVNNQEKLRALRAHGINASIFSVMKHYLYILKSKR